MYQNVYTLPIVTCTVTVNHLLAVLYLCSFITPHHHHWGLFRDKAPLPTFLFLMTLDVRVVWSFKVFQSLRKTATTTNLNLIRVTNALLNHVIFQALCDRTKRQTEVIVRAKHHRDGSFFIQPWLLVLRMSNMYFYSNCPLICSWYRCCLYYCRVLQCSITTVRWLLL